MRWLDGITDSMDVSLSDREARRAAIHGVAKSRTRLSEVVTGVQTCLILCDPIDGSRPGSPDPEILQARTLEWVATSFSNE